MEAILSATALGGEIMLHPHELGKVHPGYYADLLLVNGNPLEDISLLSHSENIEVIVVVSRMCIDGTCVDSLQEWADPQGLPLRLNKIVLSSPLAQLSYRRSDGFPCDCVDWEHRPQVVQRQGSTVHVVQ